MRTFVAVAALWATTATAQDTASLVQATQLGPLAHQDAQPHQAAPTNATDLALTALKSIIAEGAKRQGATGSRAPVPVDSAAAGKIMKSATAYLKSGWAARNQSGENCGVLCQVTSVIDALLLFYPAVPKGAHCDVLIAVYWWGLGMATLMKDQKLDAWEAMHKLTQQVTSIGYGSSTPQTQGMKLFHAMHGLISNINVLPLTIDVVKWFGNSVKVKPEHMVARETLYVILATLVSTIFFATDFHDADKATYPTWWKALSDAFYTTIISETSVGYGDLNPMTNWGKATSVLLLPTVVAMFDRYVSITADGTLTGSEGRIPPFCQCFGMVLEPLPMCKA